MTKLPKAKKTGVLTMRLAQPVRDEIGALAAAEQRSVSEMSQRLIEEALAERKRPRMSLKEFADQVGFTAYVAAMTRDQGQ